ncbi:probable serine/threonine-protein kinase DDB_G0280133 [Vespula pensylvanica]|uniref:probable serine/threonine-protein kinase DDB_G0280133 n=1 Tax=Vespula pensylvanica TaxID=30213 RepID=UPI001CB9FB8A|nr:probable serine/threonine-protein kinase DDB_G0280133 [Vespula pensylvanica]XP_043680527.1 probable serine/threonine-protein kinase DDB_G0280133 [Vespula pensylvanica]
MANSIITSNTELRKLHPAHKYALAEILNVSDSWKKLMAIIPRDDTNMPRFNSEHVSIIDQVSQKHRENAAKIFLEEWSTMGRLRPRLQNLLDLLTKAELFRAADYVANEILKVDLPKRPEYGPAAIIDISDETLARLMDDSTKLDNDEDDKSSPTLESSYRVNVGEIIYFSDAVDLMDPCSMKSNTQNFEEINANKKAINLSAQNILVPSVNYKHLEVSSQELPLFLKNFEQSRNMNDSVKSEEIPVFLNESISILDKSEINSNNNWTNIMNVNNGTNSTNCNSSFKNTEDKKDNKNYQFQSEVTSSLLPEFVNNRTETNILNETNNIHIKSQNIMNSEDLPLTVLEFNR